MEQLQLKPYNSAIINEGYFNDHETTSDDLTADIEQTSSQNLSSDFVMELTFSFNKTTVQYNPMMFQNIYKRLEATLPHINFIDEYKITEVISMLGTTAEHSEKISHIADFLTFVNNELQSNSQYEYKVTLCIEIVVSSSESFKAFSKEMYNIWKVGHGNSIKSISFRHTSSRVPIVNAICDGYEFISQVNVMHLYNFIFKGASTPQGLQPSAWNSSFNRHKKVPFFNHLMYTCNHPDARKDFKCEIYGYKNSQSSGLETSNAKVYYLYVTLTPKDELFNNTKSMFTFIRENFIDCLKERDGSQFTSGNTHQWFYVICFKSGDKFNTKQNTQPFYKTEHFFKYNENTPLKCRIFYCREDWTPYDSDNFDMLETQEQIEQSHKRLEFTLTMNNKK